MIEEQNIPDVMVFERGPEDDSESSLTTPVQSAKENPCIEFREGQLVFRMTNEAGGKVERFISSAQARQAFTGLPVESGWLPPGIMRYGTGTLGEWAVGFVPPKVHELEITSEGSPTKCARCGQSPDAREHIASEHGDHVFEGSTWMDRLRVPLPGLVWFGLGTTYFLWAVKTETLQPYQEIYRAPLPNTYADGSICWGLLKPERMTAATFFKAYDLFMGTTFNNHLANAKSKRAPEDVRVVLRDLGQPADQLYTRTLGGPPVKYPVEDLVRQVPQTGVTLDQAIRSYFETGEMPA